MPNIIAAAPDGCIAVIIGGRTDAIGAAYEGIGGADVGTTTEVEMGRCRPRSPTHKAHPDSGGGELE
jgi:hypothetical protein